MAMLQDDHESRDCMEPLQYKLPMSFREYPKNITSNDNNLQEHCYKGLIKDACREIDVCIRSNKLPSCFQVYLHHTELMWTSLYQSLLPYVWYSSHVSSWQGQGNDIVDDIIQKAIFQVFRYIRTKKQKDDLSTTLFQCILLSIAAKHYSGLKERGTPPTAFPFMGSIQTGKIISGQQIMNPHRRV